jgi:hypothetical protein
MEGEACLHDRNALHCAGCGRLMDWRLGCQEFGYSPRVSFLGSTPGKQKGIRELFKRAGCESGETAFDAVLNELNHQALRLSGGRAEDGFLLLNKRLKPELGILIAVDRCTTGATAHNLRGLANAYVLACENGQPNSAEEYRMRLVRELGRCAGVRELANHRFSVASELRSW